MSIVTMYVLWHTHDFYAWCRWVFDIPYEIDRGKQSWARLWALIIGGSGVFTSILSMAMLAINRHRARKSAIGQWYDRPDLTAKDLYGTASDAGGGNEETVGRGGDGRD
ncbi:hypothetical protein [Thauera sinica]|uniref:Transmembrane protein n=1 Tax=Thauera sinica TaxID=2665146 RepID=A0ABW1AVY1_9RHOO|nr:hypothetical protein [Thauera sp. K11]